MSAVPMVFAPGHGRPAIVLYGTRRSACACCATASTRCFAPVSTHGPTPPSALQAQISMSALTRPPGQHVTVEADRTRTTHKHRLYTLRVGGRVDTTITVAVSAGAPRAGLTVLL